MNSKPTYGVDFSHIFQCFTNLLWISSTRFPYFLLPSKLNFGYHGRRHLEPGWSADIRTEQGHRCHEANVCPDPTDGHSKHQENAKLVEELQLTDHQSSSC